MKKLISMLVAIVMLFAVMSVSLADSDLSYIQSKGTLVVGVTDFAPMDYKDENGNWIGFDADLAAAFAETLGVKAELVEIEWDNKVLELNSKTIDCVWNGMTLTDEVKVAMGCSNAYLNNSQVVVMKTELMDSLTGPVGVDKLAAYSFAVEAGSAGEAIAAENGFNATPVTSQAAALMEVAAGTSDAAIIDLLMAAAMVGEGTGYPDLKSNFALNDEQYGVGFRTDSDLVELCNKFFEDAEANGTINDLLVKYGIIGG